MVKTQCSTS